ncbi:MAG: hypothetical protein ACKVS9_06695 [Phycisphaerae bacterium]
MAATYRQPNATASENYVAITDCGKYDAVMFARQIPDDYFPRWRWLWQVLALAIVLSLTLVVMWQGTAWETHRRLVAVIGSLREAGEPVTIADRSVALSTSIDSEDAEIRNAYAAGVKRLNRRFFAEIVTHRGWVILEQVEELLAETADARVRIRLAIEAGRPLWATHNSSPPAHAEGVLALQFVAIDAARCNNDVEEAVREIRLTQHILDDVCRGPSSVLSHIVAYRWSVALHDRLARIALTANLGEFPSVDLLLSEQVARLLDERRTRDRWREMIIGERAEFLDEIASSTGIGAEITSPPHFAPAIDSIRGRRAALDYLSYTSTLLNQSELNDYERVEAAVPVFPEARNRAERLTQSLSAIVIPHFNAYWGVAPLAENRCAAIAIAAAQYFRDHGQYPVTAYDLVPEYLPIVPSDPFSSAQSTFSFVETCTALEIRGAVIEARRRTKDEIDQVWISLPKAPLAECVENDE